MKVNNSDKRLRFSKNFKYLIDDRGSRIEYDDPRVVHVWPISTSDITTKLIGSMFKSRGWRFRSTGKTNTNTLNYAKKLCSGRECLPAISLTGATYFDMCNNRDKDEITIYYSLDQNGPCQNGAWPVVWDTFAQRIDCENVLFLANPNFKNNFMGQGDSFASDLGTAAVTGDILDEAETTVRCLALYKDQGIEQFEKETEAVIESACLGKIALIKAIKIWAENCSNIILKDSLKNTPKVLLFGGLNVMFIHYPITDFFEKRGVIPKIVEFSEGLGWLTSESVIRYGFKNGRLTPKEQFKIMPLLLSVIKDNKSRKEGVTALRARCHLKGLDFIANYLRKIAGKSGLLYDNYISTARLAEAGHNFSCNNGFNETCITTGRYIITIEEGVFDGLINVDSFNCQPAMNSQSIIRPMANKADIPFAVIDCEAPAISANQRRLLDTIAVQAKRIRTQKNR